MDLPLKIIYKFKNNQNVYQYFLYIFVGNVPDKLKKVLKKFQDLDYKQTLNILTKDDLGLLVKYYTNNWHTYFFTSYHLLGSKRKQSGSASADKQSGSASADKQSGSASADNLGLTYKEDVEDDEDEYKVMNPYGDENETKKETKKDIQTFEKITKEYDVDKLKLIPFDTSKNETHQKENLKYVYQKKYIFNYAIMDDDTITTLKKKICASIASDKKYEYLVPSRIYLYSSFHKDNEKQHKMIGHKWIKKTEDWNINVVPNEQIEIYYNLVPETELIKTTKLLTSNYIKLINNHEIILYDYKTFIPNNEIFLMDIYHELGTDITLNDVQVANLYDTYIHIYYPKINVSDVPNIIKFLNDGSQNELDKLKNGYERLVKDITIQQQPIDVYNEIRLNEEKEYKSLQKEYYITSTIVSYKNDMKNIDLQLIFDSFITNVNYPFIQYQSIKVGSVVKINKAYTRDISVRNKENIKRWLQTTPFGLSFKILAEQNKYVTITFLENGSVEYRSQWKEEEKMTLSKLKKTFPKIIDLIKTMNDNENIIHKFKIPSESDFAFIFINMYQNIEIDVKAEINFKEFSKFASFFFPFVAIVKREGSKESNETILHYKRVSNYEQSISDKIDYFIKSIMEKYQYTTDTLIQALMSMFNLKQEEAFGKLKEFQEKYTSIKKKLGKLKKMTNLPKVKTTGIRVEIQKKHNISYVYRVIGSKNENQLHKIMNLIGILIYLYVEIFLKQKSNKMHLHKFLKEFSNVAKQRQNIDVIEDVPDVQNNIKSLSFLDKKRFGFVPNAGESNYSRLCMKDSQPQGHNKQNISDLIELGYTYDESLKTYVYPYTITKKNKKITKLLKAVRLPNLETGEDIYYTCHPSKNKDKIYLGILEKDKHPQNECMPCCYITDHSVATDIKKKKRYVECVQNKELDVQEQQIGSYIFYILQDTNKLSDGRFGFLPRELDIFMNNMLGLTRKMKDYNHIDKTNGFFLKYGIKQDMYSFLNAISATCDVPVAKIRQNIKTIIQKESIFTSLDNGNIRLRYDTPSEYMDNLDSRDALMDVLTIPGVLDANGANIIIFEKSVDVIYDKETNSNNTITDYTIVCQNPENIEYIFHPKRKVLCMLKEYNNYYPIFLYIKKTDLKYELQKTFSHTNDKIVEHIYEFYNDNCGSSVNILQTYPIYNSKQIYQALKNTEYVPEYQVLNSYYKTIYLLTKNKYIIPVIPSGCIANVDIKKDITKYLHTEKETTLFLNKLDTLYKLNITKHNLYVPNTTHKNINIDYLVDQEIVKGRDNYVVDERILMVNLTNFKEETYQILKLNFSHYLKANPNATPQNIKNIAHVADKLPDLSAYTIHNQRYLIHTLRHVPNVHYYKQKDTYKINVYAKHLQYYIDRLTNDLQTNDITRKEILQDENYYVSTLVDRSKITSRDNDIIIKADNPNVEIILSAIFQSKTFGIAQSKYAPKDNTLLYQSLNKENPLKYRKPFYLQKIYSDANLIFRAYANGFFWLKNKSRDLKFRNLGYIHNSQSKLANYFRGNVIDYIDTLTKDELKMLDIPNVELYKYKLVNLNTLFSYGFVELYCLHKLFRYPIFIYDKYQTLKQVIDGRIQTTKLDKYDVDNGIHLRYVHMDDATIPERVDVMYYSLI